MKRLLGLALAVTGVLPFLPAGAVTLPWQKTITIQSPGISLYEPQIASGAILNRCFASGGADCMPHEGDIAITRTGVGRVPRCQYTIDPSLTQDGDTGYAAYIVDFGVDANINGKYFKLRTVSPAGVTGEADFDIIWYWKLGSCSQAPELPTKNGDESTWSNPGPLEQGRVPGYLGPVPPNPASNCPVGANGQVLLGCPRYAIITMFQGDPMSRVKLTICSQSTSTVPTSCPASA